jgi:hypothetical protein
MNVYWFGRHTDKDLGYISDLLEDSGFYGWLLPYAVGVPDPFTRIARSLKTNQKLKYLVAVRPYTISPQYLLAISKSLDLIQEDRVRINFVPGLTDGEESFGGVFSDVNDSTSFEDRKKFFCSYLEKFKDWDVKKPYTYVSGMKDSICPNMDSLADANIVNYGRLVSGTLDTSDKTKILFFIVRDIESFRTIIKHIKENGYNNIMIHVNGDELFDLALKVFEEVKNMKLNENLL